MQFTTRNHLFPARLAPLLLIPALWIAVCGCSSGSSHAVADATGDWVEDSGGDPADIQLEDLQTGENSPPADLLDVELEPEDAASVELPPEDIGPPKHVSDSFSTRETVRQIYVWSAEPEIGLQLVGPDGEVLQEGMADYQGSLVFREITPGPGYSIRLPWRY